MNIHTGLKKYKIVHKMQNNSRSLINFVIAWESKVHKVKTFIKVYKTQCTQFGSGPEN